MMDEYHVQQAMNEFAWDNNFFPQDYYGSLDPYGNPHTRDNCSIMDFFIPYFSQDYSFGYKGEKISNPSGDDEE
jgi:spermidine/putrescine-binding protein